MLNRILAGALALALMAVPALAQDRIVPGKAPAQVDAAGAVVVVDPGTGSLLYGARPLAYVQMTSLSSAAALSSIPTAATNATIIVESQAVRYRLDGTNPTASVGMPVPVGGVIKLQGATAIAAFRVIEQTASTKLNVEYDQ